MPPIYNNKSSNGFGSMENNGKPFGPKSAYAPMKPKQQKITKPKAKPMFSPYKTKATAKNSWGNKAQAKGRKSY